MEWVVGRILVEPVVEGVQVIVRIVATYETSDDCVSGLLRRVNNMCGAHYLDHRV